MKNFKIQHAFIFLAIVIPAFLISCNKDEEVKLAFNITLPDNWTYVVLGNEGYIYAAGREPVNSDDSIREGLYIYRESLPGWSLTAYYITLKPIILAQTYFNEIIYQSDTVINDIEFKKMRSSEVMPYVNKAYADTFFVDAITERYFMMNNDYGYNLVFTSVDSLFSENRPIFDGIMGTFSFKN